MPELPEVETFKRFFDQHALGKRVCGVEVFQEKILADTTTAQLQKALRKHRFSQTMRRGKYLFVKVDSGKTHSDPWLLLHFGMTGYLSYGDKHHTVINAYHDPARPQAHVRAQFNLEDGSHLAFHEQRMFGYMALVTDPQVTIRDKKLGPDALEIDEKSFLERLEPRKGKIKPILMNQSFVSGIGNVYADEMLFQCRIYPEKAGTALSAHQRQCLFRQMRDVLQNAVDCGADRDQLPAYYLLHSRQAKGRCPRDNAALEYKSVGGRTTYFCPVCQKD